MASPTVPPLRPPSSARVERDLIGKAVSALLKWNKSKSKTMKPQLLEGDHFIYLVLTLKRIPTQKAATNASLVPLPHPLHAPPSSSELCLIIDDRSNSGLTSDLAKKKLKSDEINVAKVLKLSKLKTDYREFERKRKLCDSYDLFLADRRVVPLLPRLLGKHFFKKRKIPVPVDLRHRNWKEQIERVCGSALLYLRTGTCCVLKVARASMEEGEIVENLAAAIDGVAQVVPKKWANVRSFHVKLLESTALPVYQALPDVRLRIEGVKSSDGAVEKNEEVLGIIGKGKGEKPSVGKKKTPRGGKLREVRYMDSNVDELGIIDDDGAGSEDIEDDESGAEKMKSGGGSVEGGVVLSKKIHGKKVKRLEKVKNGDVSKKKKHRLAVETDEESGALQETKKKKVGKLKLKQ